jgi:hypothetical protein
MNSPIVAHIEQNTRARNYWLYIVKLNPLWNRLDKWIVRYIYWTIYEQHPAQLWHDRVFDEITAGPARKLWYLHIPPKYGKTYMINRLQAYFYLKRREMPVIYLDGSSYLVQIDKHAQNADILIVCNSLNMALFQNDEFAGLLVEYRKLETNDGYKTYVKN